MRNTKDGGDVAVEVVISTLVIGLYFMAVLIGLRA